MLAAKIKVMKTKGKKIRNSSKPFEEIFEDEPSHSTSINMMSQDNSILSTSMNTLSAVSISIPECKPIDKMEEIDRRSFENWKELLEASMELAGIADENTKNNVFKVKAGSMLREVLEGTPTLSIPDVAIALYSNAMKRLGNFFSSREYRLVQRQKFRSLTQNMEESDLKYLKRVIAAATLCDFDEEKLTEGVTEVIQLHALNAKVREAGRKIMRKGGTLAALVEKVQGYEVHKANEEIFMKTHQPAMEARVAVVTRGRVESVAPPLGARGRNFGFQGRPNWRSFINSGGNFSQSGSKAPNKPIACWRCTSQFHAPSQCHATDKVCRNCKKTGHIKRACRQTSTSNTLKRRASRDEEGPVKSRKIATVTKEENEKEETNIVSAYST
ncbi:uncharacterized protein LOC118513756 [Anopheles stephensi]|uniref:uncharacterized protein LOC118513756 n=1 Tax=Anopheles stephensi TaxID=30069 RepID=UPI0016589BB2|nr:uncharacterized protein LOC118513756 [Anopheles stephensi]